MYLGLIWCALWVLRPDVRREMLVVGFGAMWVAPWVEVVFFQDWWQPVSVWGTAYLKLESFVFGFLSGGVCAVLPQVVQQQTYMLQRHSYRPRMVHEAAGLVVSLMFFYGSWALGLHSFYAALLACTWLVGCFAVRRPDLLGNMAASMVYSTLLMLPAYWLWQTVNPIFFADQWYLHNLSGFWALGLPVEEIVWYAYSAAMFAGAWKCREGIMLTTARAIARPVKRRRYGWRPPVWAWWQ
jgi:hypothetical protein